MRPRMLGATRCLEWGPRRPGAGGGSLVRDGLGGPVRTGDAVVSLGADDGPGGQVVELLDDQHVLVRWGEAQPLVMAACGLQVRR